MVMRSLSAIEEELSARVRSVVLSFDPIRPDPAYSARARVAVIVLEHHRHSRFGLAFASAMDAGLPELADLVVESIEARGIPVDLLE